MALPGGLVAFDGFINIGNYGIWWSLDDEGVSVTMGYFMKNVWMDTENKSFLLSVRYVQD